MFIGYARTSTEDQKAGLADQVSKLQQLGCERIFEEHGSGVDMARPKLQEAINFIREGDTFITMKADRIARSNRDLLAIVDSIRERGGAVRVEGIIDTTSPQGTLMLQILGAMAEFERKLMLERQKAGIAAAKAAGKYRGRKPTAMAKEADVRKLQGEGLGATEIAKRLGIGRASVYRVLGKAS